MPDPLRKAQLYAADGRPLIVAPMHFNSDGIGYEQNEPLVVESGAWEDVIPSLRVALEKHSFREANLRDQRLRDWPSFQASKLQSVRRFQQDYLCIWIVAVNEAELFYDASCKPRGEADISLHVTLNVYGNDEEIARLLRRLFEICLRWPTRMAE